MSKAERSPKPLTEVDLARRALDETVRQALGRDRRPDRPPVVRPSGERKSFAGD